MFKKLFAKREEPKTGGALLFICFRQSTPLDWTRIRQELDKVGPVNLSPPEGNGAAVASFEFPDGTVHVAHMPIPVPGNEVMAQAPFSRFWKSEYSADHQSHAALIGSFPSPLKGSECVSQVARAISVTHDTAAWYCGNASQILYPPIASEFVEDGVSLPIWVNVVSSMNPRGGIDASTLGLEALGHREFEIVGSRQTGGEVYELLMDVAAYVLDQGAVLKHGQTFGRNEHERFAIEVGRSKLSKPGTVIRLGLP